MARNLSPALLTKIDQINGCQGRWIIDCRELEGDRSYALRDLQESCLYSSLTVPQGDDARCWALYRTETLGLQYSKPTPEDAALYCASTGWKAKLLFVSDRINDDARWPGGYSAPSIVVSNARTFRNEFSKELEHADGDADGLALDVRFLTNDMIETIVALESYPLISEDDHSELELELQEEEWQNWAERDWREQVCKAIDSELPEEEERDGEEIIDAVEGVEDKLRELFHACCDQSNQYWEEQCCGHTSEGYWIRLEEVAKAITRDDLRNLTGLQLTPPDQLWRQEPYPWAGAEPAPLLPPVEAVEVGQ
jgi:hypothetical protein